MKNCPECWSEQRDEAEVCSACGRQIVGRTCPQCAEVVKLLAEVCRYCGHSFAREEKIAAIESYSVRAGFWPTLLIHGRLIPERISLTPEKITIQSWGLFGLSRRDEEIPWEKIAGFHYHSGILWDSVEIQTRGQKSNSISCLPKSRGLRIKQTLEEMRE